MALATLFPSTYCAERSICVQVDLWVLLVAWLLSCLGVAWAVRWVHKHPGHYMSHWLMTKCCCFANRRVVPRNAAMMALKRDASAARITSHKNNPENATRFVRQTQQFAASSLALGSFETTDPSGRVQGKGVSSTGAIPIVKVRRASNVLMDVAAASHRPPITEKPRGRSLFLRRQVSVGKRILLLGGTVHKFHHLLPSKLKPKVAAEAIDPTKDIRKRFTRLSYQEKEAIAVLPPADRSEKEHILTRELTSKRRVSVGTHAQLQFFVGAAEQEQQASVYEIKLKEIQLVKRLACSSTSEIYAASWRDTKVCVKLLLPQEGMVQNLEQSVKNFRREIWIMSILKHANVLELIGASLTSNCYALVMEYMSNGSLYDYLRDENNFLPTEMMMTCAYDVAAGMKYIHQCKVLQRDLKSRNLLLSDNLVVKVCDFGLSRFQDLRYGPYTFVGTPFWAAPEIIRHEPYSEKADVFSYGIVLWELVERKDPYENYNPFQVPLLVANESLRPAELTKPAPPGYEQLMRRCWHPDPSLRPSFVEIYEFFDHWHRPLEECSDGVGGTSGSPLATKDLSTHVLARHLQTNVTERDHFATIHDLHEKSIPIVLSSKLQHKPNSHHLLLKQNSADTL